MQRLELWLANFKYFFFTVTGGYDALKRLVELIVRHQQTAAKPSSGVAFEGRGWELYQHELEFFRLFGPDLGTSRSKYRLSGANAQYALCASYPFLTVVPATITDETLTACAKFRSCGRFPAISWIGPSGATLSRCSQPLVGMGGLGLSGQRSAADEQARDSAFHQLRSLFLCFVFRFLLPFGSLAAPSQMLFFILLMRGLFLMPKRI